MSSGNIALSMTCIIQRAPAELLARILHPGSCIQAAFQALCNTVQFSSVRPKIKESDYSKVFSKHADNSVYRISRLQRLAASARVLSDSAKGLESCYVSK